MLLKCFRGAQDFSPVLLRLPLLGSPPGHAELKGWWGSGAVVTAFSCPREPVLLMSLEKKAGQAVVLLQGTSMEPQHNDQGVKA